MTYKKMNNKKITDHTGSLSSRLMDVGTKESSEYFVDRCVCAVCIFLFFFISGYVSLNIKTRYEGKSETFFKLS